MRHTQVFIAAFLTLVVAGVATSISLSHPEIVNLDTAQAYANNTTQSVDVHNINVQLYGNTSSQEGFPAYIIASQTKGTMPQAMFIVFRAPSTPKENSTITVSVNGTYQVQNLQFHDKGNYSFTTKLTGSVPITIAIHSPEMNFTRVFHYTASIETIVNFVKYYQNKVNEKHNNKLTVSEGFIVFGVSAAIGIFTGNLGARYVRWQKNSNPDLDNFRIGGVGGIRL